MPSSCCEMRLRKDRVYYFPASLSTPRKWPAHPRYTCRYITLAKRQPLCAPRPRASGDRSAVGAGARGGGPAREPGGPALASPGPRARRGRRHPVGRLVQRYTLEVYSRDRARDETGSQRHSGQEPCIKPGSQRSSPQKPGSVARGALLFSCARCSLLRCRPLLPSFLPPESAFFRIYNTCLQARATSSNYGICAHRGIWCDERGGEHDAGACRHPRPQQTS